MHILTFSSISTVMTEHMKSFFIHKNVESALPSSADFMLSESRVNSATKFNALSLNARLCPDQRLSSQYNVDFDTLQPHQMCIPGTAQIMSNREFKR